jgi:hypothetical protein
MMWALFKRLFHFQEMILLLSLTALACLPIALSNLVRDASISLLLPITLIGTFLAWLLARWKVQKRSSGIILLFLGPLSLFIRIGQLGRSVLELLQQTFRLIPPLFNWLRFGTSVDTSFFAASASTLSVQFLAFASRLALWVHGLFTKTHVEDPVARTLIWSLCLWLAAIWAGWQIQQNRRLLLGILPSTILLAFVLDYTGREVNIIWLHIALLLFLVGMNSYVSVQKRWDQSHIDYADSTSQDTLIIAGLLTVTLVVFAYLGSTISIKDILEDLRERRAASNGESAESLGLEPAKDNYTVASSFGGLPRSHLIGAGPELSTQVVMNISTGDLPPMSLNSQAIAPRYYWRTQTYQIYTGSGWANPATTSDQISANQTLFEPPEENIRIVHQQMTFPAENGQLFWAGTLLSVDAPFQAVWNHRANQTPQTDPKLAPDLLAALAPVQTYRADSILLKVKADELRKSSGVYPAWIQKQFLPLPESVPERVLSLARDLTASQSNPYDRAIAIQNYLREYPYTLDVTSPPGGRDVVDYFLFDLKRGYCDYYATAMVVLARAAGLPARLVVGYANGTYDRERAEYIVTENYAHSWVEIYFTHIGWVEFEPTASEPVITYDEPGSISIPAPVTSQNRPFCEEVAQILQRMLKSVWIILIGVITFIFLGMGWDALRIRRLEPVQAIQLLFQRLRRLAHPIHGAAPLEQTAHQFAFALTEKILLLKTSPNTRNILVPSAREISELTELYSRSLFARSLPNQTEASGAIKTWSRLRWRLLLANLLTIRKK